MIQRKQSIFLSITVIISALLLFFPYAQFALGSELQCNIRILGLQGIPFTQLNYLFWILQVLFCLFLGITLVSIFYYKRRPLQIRLVNAAFFANIMVVAMMFFLAERIGSVMRIDELSYLIPSYIPLGNLLLLAAARKGIRKDEALVRAMDRIR